MAEGWAHHWASLRTRGAVTERHHLTLPPADGSRESIRQCEQSGPASKRGVRAGWGDERERVAPRSRGLPGVPNRAGCEGCARCWARWGVGRCAAWGCRVVSTLKRRHRPSQTLAVACAPSSLLKMTLVCRKRFCVGSAPPMHHVEVGSCRLQL
jgi:hypothetical protein